MGGVLLLAAREGEYVKRVVDAARTCIAGADWQVTAFTYPAALKSYLRSGYEVEMIVAEPYFLGEIAESVPPGIPVVALVEHVGGTADEGGPEACEAYNGACKPDQVKQYQPIPRLMAQVTELYAARKGKRPPKRTSGGPLVFSIYSPAAGTGTTTLALHLARQAAEDGLRVLYLNYERWNATGLYFGHSRQEEEAMQRLYYLLQAQPEQAGKAFGTLVRHQPQLQLDYLPPLPDPRERDGLTGEVVNRLQHIIAASERYDLVISDLDHALDEAALQQLMNSDTIVLLQPGQVTGERKTAMALTYARSRWGEAFAEVERKLLPVHMGGLVGGAAAEDQAVTGAVTGGPQLPFVAEWAFAKQPGELLNSAVYRGAVRRVLQQLVGSAKPAEGRDARDGRSGSVNAPRPYPGAAGFERRTYG